MQPPRSERELFADVLHREVGVLQARFPELSDALARAYAIVAGGRLFVEDDGRSAMALASDGTTYYHVNGRCQCKASMHRNEPCKHRLAFRLYPKVADAMREDAEAWEPVDPPAPVAAQDEQPVVPHTDARLAEQTVLIQGKPFVKFEGLLALAHAQGLVALETTLVQCTLDMAVCQCVARFADGRTFTDIGDASPESVARHLRLHYVRMAATRASARALRRALNVDHCAVEELGGQEIE